MTKAFYERYKRYESFPIEYFKHIPEISFYNHNYYIGAKRDNSTCHDLIFAECDELAGVYDYYHINCNFVQHIGYAYEGDKYITLHEEELT